MQLSLVDQANQSLVVAAHQQVVAGAALGQQLQVSAQGAQHRQAAVLAVRQHGAADLPANRLVVRCIAVPIDATQVHLQTVVGQRTAEQLVQLGAHMVLCGVGLALQPSQKTSVNEGNA